MRSYERNRILVDQCTGCGGLFLDKGELEKLSAAENAWHEEPVHAPVHVPQSVQDDRLRYDDRTREAHSSRTDDRQRYDKPRYDDRHDGYGRPRKKKKSFLSELFDD